MCCSLKKKCLRCGIIGINHLLLLKNNPFQDGNSRSVSLQYPVTHYLFIYNSTPYFMEQTLGHWNISQCSVEGGSGDGISPPCGISPLVSFSLAPCVSNHHPTTQTEALRPAPVLNSTSQPASPPIELVSFLKVSLSWLWKNTWLIYSSPVSLFSLGFIEREPMLITWLTHKRDTKGQAQRGCGVWTWDWGVCWTCGDATAYDTSSPQTLSGPFGGNSREPPCSTSISDSLSESPQPAW